MRKIYTSLLVLAMFLVGTVAKAQYTVVIESDPIESYVAGQQSFDAAEIAQALGLADAAALKTLVDESNAVYLGVAEDKTNAYTGNHNEFWMNSAGVPQGYGDDGTSWFVGLEFEAAGTDEESGDSWEDRINVYVGQMPGVFKKIYEASELKAMLYLVSGEKEVSFDVTQKVTAAPEPTLEAPTKILSQLNIVADYTLTLNFEPGKSYEGKQYSAELEGLYDALGLTAADLDKDIADYTFTQIVHIDSVQQGDGTEKVAVYSINNDEEMMLPAEASGGAWYGRYSNFDELNDKDEYLAINLPKAWNTGANTFYVQQITLADGVFTITSGQFPGVLVEGDTDYTYLYIINGTKAARVKVQVEVKPKDTAGQPDTATYTKVGETSITQTATKLMDYMSISSPIENIEEIATALGCEASDITFWHPTEGSTVLDDALDDGWGTWVNGDGVQKGWNDNSAIMIAFELQDGVYQISTLQMAGGNYLKENPTITFPVYLVNEANGTYWQINFTYSYEAPVIEITQKDWERVATYSFDVQLIPQAESYALNETTKVDMDQVKSALGVEDATALTLYADIFYEAGAEVNPDSVYSNAYSCTPYPGYWMYSDENNKMYASTWNSTNAIGMTWSTTNGVITWYNKPGERKAGDAYVVNFYLVDEVAGKFVTLTCNITFVTEVVEVETVGEEDFAIVMTEDKLNDSDYYAESVSLATAFTALGITEDEYDACVWYVLGTNGVFVSPEEVFNDADCGSSFTALGRNVSSESEDAVFVVGMDDYNSALRGYSFFAGMLNGDPEEGKAYSTKVALRYENKQYIFNIVIGDSQEAVGINTVSENVKSNKVYDLSGRLVKNPTKGLYIMNGKTYFVK